MSHSETVTQFEYAGEVFKLTAVCRAGYVDVMTPQADAANHAASRAEFARKGIGYDAQTQYDTIGTNTIASTLEIIVEPSHPQAAVEASPSVD